MNVAFRPTGDFDTFFSEDSARHVFIGSPFYSLKRILETAGYTLVPPDRIDGNTVAYVTYTPDIQQLQMLKKFPSCKTIYLQFEPEPVYRFNSLKGIPLLKLCYDYILTVYPDHVDNKRSLLIHFPIDFDGFMRNNVGTRAREHESTRAREHESTRAFGQKKLAVMMLGNKKSFHTKSIYGERIKVIDWFTRYHPESFDLYGWGWPPLSVYKGVHSDKMETFSKYKFSFCFENALSRGCISEKIWTTFAAKCVPVYYGDKGIGKIIPPECFIDFTSFSSMEELFDFLNSMTEETYQKYLDAIEALRGSEAEATFSVENLARILIRAIHLPKQTRYSPISVLRLFGVTKYNWLVYGITSKLTKYSFFQRFTH